MKQRRFLDFIAPAGMVKYRFVTIDKANDTVAYCAAGAKPDAITISDEDNLQIGVQLLDNLNASFLFDAAGTIAKGGPIQVTGAVGKGLAQTTGAVACYAKDSAVDGSICTGYKVQAGQQGVDGTPGTGVTAVEEGTDLAHRTTLTVSTTLGAIAGGADLGLGILVYTLPAGVINITGSYMSMALDEADGNITADTPDVGIGTVVASGAVAVLSGTATFENILTGQTAADCNGTATVAVVSTNLAIGASAAHTVYFNVADGWAASGEAACAVAGTIVLNWSKLA